MNKTMTDEEKKAIEIVKGITEDDLLNYWEGPEEPYNAIQIILNLIEKQSKEREELKDDRKKYAEEYIHNNPWLYKQLNENYILRVESEQKERKAWIKGTNDAHKLCNKKWKDKIKAEIEESELLIDNSQGCMSDEDLYKEYGKIEFGQSLLEKE